VRLQEDEARFRPGTNKWVAFKVLREAGAAGLSVPQIMERSKKAGLKQWDDNAKRIIQFVRGPAPRTRAAGPLRRGAAAGRLAGPAGRHGYSHARQRHCVLGVAAEHCHGLAPVCSSTCEHLCSQVTPVLTPVLTGDTCV
jgi:hypothetical protein